MLFNDWENLFRTLFVGVLAYIALIIFLRFSGQRTLSKMNAFDLVVTVALGSTLATILLSKDVSLAQGVTAFAVLIGLQFLVSFSSVKAQWIRRFVTGKPQMLLYHGQLQTKALYQSRVTEDELRAAARSAGFSSLESIFAIVLETNGSFSVISHAENDRDSALSDVDQPDH